ncbi:MAG: hypothetical protein HYR64_02140 [Fimbriimonas ginsengisoli]|uniref:Uncharacterized protein n=1 Tax=Fimbriimonas ginsengisoli TaxID=1005039 RepID=A0A931LVZ4_FIMGI|nr:hypothetical protein [Fimbriimonas ginsengisoli]
MKLRREFTSAASMDEADERADRLLRLMKFRKTGQSTHDIYERGKRNAGFRCIRPRSFHAVLHLWIQPDPAGSKVIAEMVVETLVGTIPSVAQRFYEGELDDLEHAVAENRLPVVNRARQDRMAGTAHLAYVFACAGISFALAHLFTPGPPWVEAFPFVILYVVGLRLAPKTPAILIDYPLHTPKGAKLVPDPKDLNVPTAPTAKPRR